ncbi:YlbF family regulator [Bacillus sporothermodurans]|uniref:YlbF family regulator n=1 Tax=Heyndrickxia sporothermodurans TaxID=46224 RepID=UPI00192AA6AB|nr:YlbF family regulator [Heyndrickxia sporothermodurans]MBL5799068.1 YlbF family regulator [Heyndrickxia sporothermodurans]MBL5809958.1 YlbF family regulator [Heyndrickxia sporothermodurans]MBL5814292.1 YlbF family regulator [Heyndrickxia sporothermodurans]MBL5816975.1 YlbF family regulator [Heyndrickxia sporothermodurans]MBL5842283.1 YlbF family regulator [Heyndrickxia sporothermodurans]
MPTSFYDYAYELEKALRKSEEYTSLKANYEAVLKDPPSKKMFDEFRMIQMTLQEKQMTGQDITEQEVQKAQSFAAQVQQSPKIVKLMEAERRMSMSINELNKIIMKPLDELYGSMNK